MSSRTSAKELGTPVPFASSASPKYRTAHFSEKFIYAGLSSMAASAILNPVDVTKVRLQLQGELTANVPKKYRGLFHGLLLIWQEEGPRGWLKGLTPSMMREASYSTIRLGGYDPIKNLLQDGNSRGLVMPLWKKVLAGAISGSIGATVANPVDLIKVRMQGVGPGEKRYRNTLEAFRHIYRHEGIAGFYKGVGPTVQRACILTGVQLASYDHSKHLLLSTSYFNDGMITHFLCSFFAGFAAATACSPVDVVKSRIMNQPFGPDGKGTMYRGNLDCWKKTFRAEGVSAFFKGWFPGCMRLFPHSVISFMMFEQMRIFAGLQTI